MTTRQTPLVLATLALAVALLSPPVYADPPAGKGKDKDNTSQPYYDDRHEGKQGYDNDAKNHGQKVSECNHRANERNLKGQDRKEFVEWCTDYGDRYKYDQRRFDSDRSCYRKAEERALSGDKRRAFIEECLRKQEQHRDSPYADSKTSGKIDKKH